MSKKFKKLADRLAHAVADFMGSWWSVFTFFTLTLSWIFFNTICWFEPYHVDHFPYQFLNLVLGILAAITGPLVIIGNKAHDRKYQRMLESIFSLEKKQDAFLDYFKHHNFYTKSKKHIKEDT
jgi:uncharacterized membrane protein